MDNPFRKAIEEGEFAVTCEMIPGRGAFEVNQEKEYEMMKKIYATGRVHAISITDCPSGNPAINSMAVARRFAKDNIPALIHFTCKDRTRNEMLGELYELELDDLQNLLVMTGDIQHSGWEGAARPVFDLDPIHVLQLVGEMNNGMVVETAKEPYQEKKADFFAGCVTNPYKYRMGETFPQYYKLEKKLMAGAKYVIQQLGFDARKMQEQLFYLEERGFDVPQIANIFLVNKGAANLMTKGIIAGCTATPELIEQLTKEAEINKEQKGYAKQCRIERAAKQVAIAKGLGYKGVHIGGFGLDDETVVAILDKAEEMAPHWRDYVKDISFAPKDGFYLYKPELDENGNPTGLNSREHAPMVEDISGRKLYKYYRLSRFFHYWVLTQEFNEDRTDAKHIRFNKVLASRMDSLDKKKGTKRHHGLEHTGKAFLYGCIDCGDCGLEPAVYSCPMASCPKSQRNGPCGGSMDGYCEAYPPTSTEGKRFCIHYMAFHRLFKYDELYKYTTFITPPNDWNYWQTSAWSNYSHCRDNTAKRIPCSLGFEGNTRGIADASGIQATPLIEAAALTDDARTSEAAFGDSVQEGEELHGTDTKEDTK